MHWCYRLLAAILLVGCLVVVPGHGRTPAGVAAPASAQRPNILVVMMDDMRWDELRYAPNARRYIVNRGTRFANSFSPFPMCCPARASFLTGKYAHNHGVLYHLAPYGFGAFNDRRTLSGALSAAGYRTGMVGKYLNGYGRMRSKVTGGPSVRYKPAGWTDWMAGLETRWPRGSRLSGNTYNYMKFTQNINRRVVMHRGQYSSNVIANQTSNLISKYHAAGRPFFLWVTPVAPHQGGPWEKRDPVPYRKANGKVQQFPTPYTPTWVRGRFNRAVTHAPGVPLRHAAEPDVSDKPSYIRQYLENTRTEKLRLREVQRQRAEAIYAWDVQFGRIVSRLQQTREYRNTVMVFTSDNGYYLGEHRHPAGKGEPHEVSARVPLAVAGPGIQRGTRYAPAMTHDLTATILDLAGARTLPAMDGTSLRPVLTGPDTAWTRPVLLESRLQNLARRVSGMPRGLNAFAVRTGRYKFIRYSTGMIELYDLARDPNELHGVQQDPAYAGVKDELLGVWKHYVSCRAARCRESLPADLQVDVATLRAQDANATRMKNAYYNR